MMRKAKYSISLSAYLFILIKTSQEVTIPCFVFDDYAILISIKVYADCNKIVMLVSKCMAYV